MQKEGCLGQLSLALLFNCDTICEVGYVSVIKPCNCHFLRNLSFNLLVKELLGMNLWRSYRQMIDLSGEFFVFEDRSAK